MYRNLLFLTTTLQGVIIERIDFLSNDMFSKVVRLTEIYNYYREQFSKISHNFGDKTTYKLKSGSLPLNDPLFAFTQVEMSES